MTNLPQKLAAFPRVVEQIHEGDLLLFRSRGPIASLGRGTHNHAAKVAWWENDPFCLEVTQWKGGRAVTLESQVKKYP